VLRVAYSGSKKTPPFLHLLRAWIGMKVPTESFMSRREQFDFTILVLIFGVMVAA
jgi:MFS transporter, FLVCR family, MFS-domain-containing protein 7